MKKFRLDRLVILTMAIVWMIYAIKVNSVIFKEDSIYSWKYYFPKAHELRK